MTESPPSTTVPLAKNAAAACRAHLESALVDKSWPLVTVLLAELVLAVENEFAPVIEAVQRITLRPVLGYGSGPVSDRIFDELDAESESKRESWYCVEKGAMDALRDQLHGILGKGNLDELVRESPLPAAERVAQSFVSRVARYLHNGAQGKELEAQLAFSITRELLPLIKAADALLYPGSLVMGQGRTSSFLSDERGAAVTLASETQWEIVNGTEFDALRAVLLRAGAA